MKRKRPRKNLRERRLQCSSGKASYRDRIAADLALARIKDGPKRSYRCPECHRWHLTSKGRPRKPGERPRTDPGPRSTT